MGKKNNIETNKLESSTLCSKDGYKNKNTIWWKLDCISSLQHDCLLILLSFELTKCYMSTKKMERQKGLKLLLNI